MTIRKIIPVDVYGCKVIVTFTDNINAELLKFHNKKLIKYSATTIYYGVAIPEPGTDSYHVVLNSKLLDLNTIVHESFHIAYEILDERSIVTTKKHDEPLAYLLGYIVEKIVDHAKRLKIKL